MGESSFKPDRPDRTRVESRVDVDANASERGGLLGLLETSLRRFRSAVHAATLLPLYGLACLTIGIANVPGIYLFQLLTGLATDAPSPVRYLVTGASLALAYLSYGFSMILIVPLVNFTLRARLRPWRGPYYSLDSVRWYIHNALTYVVRYTFLEFITPTPFNLFFFRAMGMRIGRGSQINTSHISDPSLIEIGEKVTIGGSVTLVAHYGQAGYLVIAPVRIGDRVTIGLRATIMGGVEIGAGAKILPNSVVMPKTIIPPGETWGGVPARHLEEKKAAA